MNQLVRLLNSSSQKHIQDSIRTNSGKESGNRRVVLVTSNLVRAEDVSTDALNDTGLSITLVLKLPQAEGEGTELLLDLRKKLARAGALEGIGGGGAAVEGSAVLELLNLAGSQADAHLDTPDLANLGDTLALGVLASGNHNLLLALNLVAVKEPRGGALDEVAVVGADNLLEKVGDLGLRRRLLGGGLGLLLIGTGSEKTRGNHEAEEDLVGVVVGENQVSVAALDNIVGLVLGGGNDGVANDGAEAIDLSTELDLDGLTGLDLDSSLLLVGAQGSVGSDESSGRDGSGVGEALGDLLAAVDLGKLLLDELVALGADVDDLLAGDDELGDLSKDLLRDLSSGLVLGEGIGVVEGVV